MEVAGWREVPTDRTNRPPTTREIVGEDLDLPVRANAAAERGPGFGPGAAPHRDAPR
jgi:hypothetical protein